MEVYTQQLEAFQGISPIVDYHQLQLGGIKSRERDTFCEELVESMSSTENSHYVVVYRGGIMARRIFAST